MYVLDCYTPIAHSVRGTPYEDMLTQNNYVLGAAREFFAGQTLFLHGSIAYCMHAVMVRKVPGCISSSFPPSCLPSPLSTSTTTILRKNTSDSHLLV